MLSVILVVVSVFLVGLFGITWGVMSLVRRDLERQERERFNRILQASESRERIVPRASGLRGDHRKVS
jgi:ABC-type methionine transport system permease subunit